MINNYYPLYLYTIGFLFLLLFLHPPFSLSLCPPPTFVIIRGARARTRFDAFATRAKLNCVGRERTSHFCALWGTQIDAHIHTQQRLLWSPRSCQKLTKAKTENGCLMMSLAKWWDRFCGEFHQEASYCLFILFMFFSLLFISLFCVNCFCILPLLLDMNEIKSLTVYKVLYRVFFCSGFEYMHVSVHIYKHLALYFFV